MAGALVTLLPCSLALALTPGLLPSFASALSNERVLSVERSRGRRMQQPLARRLAAKLPIGAAMDHRWVQRLWFASSTLAIGTVLVLTKSRGAWLAAGAAFLVLLAYRWRWVLWALPVPAVGAGLTLWWFGGVQPFLNAIAPGSGLYEQWLGRVELWSRALYAIQDFAYTGAGAGTFAYVTDVLYPLLLKGPNAGIPHAHNLFLQVAFDLGLPGLIAFLALLMLALWCAWDGARSFQDAGERALSALSWAGLASLVAVLVHGAVDATTWIVSRGAFVPWAVIGTILALHRAARTTVPVREEKAT
jgi:putative inorganic carbon (HCO3(-)) transporter